MNPIQKSILLGSQKNLDSLGLMIFEETLASIQDWGFILRFLQKNHLSGLFYKNILKLKDRKVVPDAIFLVLKNKYLTTLVSNTKKNIAFREIHKTLKENGIDTIPLKGMVLKETVYKDLGLRILSDIDLLVKEIDLEKIKDLMVLKGWEVLQLPYRNDTHEKIYKEIAHHPYILKKDKITIEIHIHIHRIKHNKFKVAIYDFWNRAQETVFLDSQTTILNSADLLLHLCLHTQKDFLGNAIKLKSFTDIVELLRTEGDTIDFKLFWKNLANYNCKNEVEQILILCIKYYQLPTPKGLVDYINLQHLDKKYVLLFNHIFVKTNSARLFYCFYQFYRKDSEKINVSNTFLSYWIGFIFPSKSFVIYHYNKKHKSKIHYNLYRFIGIIKTT